MMQKIRLQTPEGIRELPIARSSEEYETGKASGEIAVGMDIVYKNFLVRVIEDYEMLVLEGLRGVPQFNSCMPNGFNMDIPNGAQWSFTVNGQPVTPERRSLWEGMHDNENNGSE